MTTPEGWGWWWMLRLQVPVSSSQCALLFPRWTLLFLQNCPSIFLRRPFVSRNYHFVYQKWHLVFGKCLLFLKNFLFFLELSFIFQKCVLFNYCARLFPRMLFVQNDICLALVLLPLGTLHEPNLDVFFITLKSLHRVWFFSDFLHCPWQCKNKVSLN